MCAHITYLQGAPGPDPWYCNNSSCCGSASASQPVRSDRQSVKPVSQVYNVTHTVMKSSLSTTLQLPLTAAAAAAVAPIGNCKPQGLPAPALAIASEHAHLILPAALASLAWERHHRSLLTIVISSGSTSQGELMHTVVVSGEW